MTEQIVIILIVVVVLVVLDGLRRKWLERGDRVVLKVDRKHIPATDDGDELFSSELPNGGARTIVRHGEPQRVTKPAPRLRSFQNQRESLKTEHVPVLLEAVELEEDDIEHTNVFADTSSVSLDAGAERSRAEPVEGGVDASEEAGEASGRLYGNSIEDYLEAIGDELNDTPAQLRPARDEDDEGHWHDEWEEGDDEDDDYEDDDYDDEEGDENEDDGYDEDDDEDDEDDDRYDEDDDYDEDEDEDWDEHDDDDYEGFESGEEFVRASDERDDALLADEEEGIADIHQRIDASGRIEPTFGEALAPRKRQRELFPDRTAPAAAPQEDREPYDADPYEAEPSSVAAQQPEPTERLDRAARLEDVASKAAAPTPASPQPAPSPDFQEVVIINVMSRPGTLFAGEDLLHVLQAQGMRLGSMSIFHKLSDSAAGESVVYSMANMVKPGTFDLASMNDFQTPGVSLFMQMPNKAGNMQAFDQMLDTAVALQQTLHGELKDENRSVFTRQTIEHCRQRIRDFELKLLAHR